MTSKSKRKRNYAKEYLIRIARGLAGGRSRAQARGHARAADVADEIKQRPFDRSNALEEALKLMKQGVSQRNAAKQAGVSPERLRRFQKANTTSHRKGRRWIISDTRPVSVARQPRGFFNAIDVNRTLRIAAADAGRSCPQRTPEPPRTYEALRALRGCRLERPAELLREIGKVD
jgi:hypothetical protein